ncbi:efflux RND transporter periplasmic adaptor subunit [Litorimonas sp.]|uniref:efflux RND transporter periplasmic adaptor subunit n=1 Tax=Litorimonas sp. TaxID=1892381 RepID=UPI003A852177
MTLKHKLLVSLTLILTACQGGQDEKAHDHAAMQAGKTDMSSAEMSTAETGQYTCPMHPHYISSDPDGSCPICGMDLVPVSGGASDSGGIAVSPEMIQTMGIRTVKVGTFDLSSSLRAFGTVEPNTRLETMAASRLEGWIDNLTVRAEGDIVRRGERLYYIYAPDLIAAQKDFLASLQIGNERRIESVRQRLKSKGMQQSLIRRVETEKAVIERIPIYSESAGVVTELMVRDGDYIKPGDPIMRLQSYEKIWVVASVPESQLSQISVGQEADLQFESAPEANQSALVDYIYPTIDSKTRTADVRLSVDNSEGVLRPGAYANIVFDSAESAMKSEKMAVPTQAILYDSRGAHVIIALGDGRFESREIRVGRTTNGRTEILSGLKSGETVVASGQFMLDSEANLRDGFSKVSGTSLDYDPNTPLSDLPINESVLSQIDHIVDTALYFHEAIIDGYEIDPYFLDPTLKLINDLEIRFQESRLSPILKNAEQAISAAQEAKSGQALVNQLASLMTALDPWLTLGVPSHYNSKGLVFYSDMKTGRLWLQEKGLPANPYSNDIANEIAWPDPMEGKTP